MLTRLLALAALIGTLTVAHAEAQTIPQGLCGFASVVTVKVTCVTTGCGTASFTTTNTPSSPTIPTVTTGSIIGGQFFVSGNPINVTTDGTAPTALVGQSYGPGALGGSAFVACGTDLTNLKWVTASPSLGNATINAIFYTNGR